MRISSYWIQRLIAGSLIVLLTAPLLAQTQQPLRGGQEGTSTSQSSTAPEPVGTAVAPLEKTVGAASSRPAGAVIAPAKQRRAHSLLIKVGLIVGAAAAIGTVVALSKSSPSRPN